MPAPRPSLCITCGLDAAAGQFLNRMPDGRACPACAERLLDMLPPPFPGFGHMTEPTLGTRIHALKAVADSKARTTSPKRVRRGRRRGSK